MRLDELKSPKLSTSKPLYVCRYVENTDDIEEWARGQGFTDILVNLHVTIAHSSEPVVWDAIPKADDKFVLEGGRRRMHKFGKAIVILLDSDELDERWEEFGDHGASWDFPSYRPHVTILYDEEDEFNIKDIEPYRGEIVFGKEVFEEIIDDDDDDAEERKAEVKRTKSLGETQIIFPTLLEAKIEWAGSTKVYVNPRRKELLELLEGGDIRGIADDRNIYLWMADLDTHMDVMKMLGIGYQYYDNRFHIFAPWEDEHDGEHDWRGPVARDFAGYTIACREAGFRHLDMMTSFIRLFREPATMTEEVNPSPKKFWLVFDINDRNRDVGGSLSRLELAGVRGISGDRRIMGEFFHVSGNACLVMDPMEVMAENDIEMIDYDDPRYLCRNNMAALYRLWDKNPSHEGDRIGMMQNLLREVFRSLPHKNFMDSYNYLWKVSHAYGQDFPTLNTPEEVSLYIKEAVESLFVEHRYNGTLTINDVQSALRKSFNAISETFSSEAEWLVTSPKLRIPAQSTLLILAGKNIVEKFNQWKDGAYVPEQWENWQFERFEKILKTIKTHNLKDLYRIRFVDEMTYASSIAKAQSRRRERKVAAKETV